MNPRKSPEACFQCHLDKRGEFSLPHTHPVIAGKVSCVDCHDVHKGDAVRGGGASLAASTETCIRCHTQQAGPFTYPHGAIREEGCVACLNPHGTVNDKMLVARDANLCMRCHLEVLYARLHRRRLQGRRSPRECVGLPACPRAPAGPRAATRDVHGSQCERFASPINSNGGQQHAHTAHPLIGRISGLIGLGAALAILAPRAGASDYADAGRRFPLPYESYIKISGQSPLGFPGTTRHSRRIRQRPSRGSYGIEDLLFTKDISNASTLTVKGRGAFGGAEDYLASFNLETLNVGSVDVGYKRFRTFYDGVGGFFPLADQFERLTPEQLGTLTAAHFGLTLNWRSRTAPSSLSAFTTRFAQG